MSVSTLPDVIRRLACLSDVRGAADALDLRAAVQTLDALNPAGVAAVLDRARDSGFAGLPGISPAAARHLHNAAFAGAEATLASARARIPTLLRRNLERQMHLGVGTARRGWVEARHVLNTRPLSDVQAFIRTKRTRQR